MSSTFRRISTPHRAVLAVFPLAAVLACTLLATHAYAAEGSQYGTIGQYGEVTRLGGFDSTAYSSEKYNGTLTGGKFLNPVGFAVDTKDTTAGGDGTAIYVLDRISDWGDELTGSTPTEWRLQKLSDKGAVLGTTVFTLPNPPVTTQASALGVNSPTGVLGLAIDDNTGRIYTLLYTTTGSGNSATPEAEEIVGWSTTPSGGQLVKPSGSTSDSVSDSGTGSFTLNSVSYSAPGVFSTAGQLESTPLYDPQGLALNVTGGQDYLAVEADKNPRASNGAPQGPAVVQQVSTSTGADAESWSAASLGVSNSDADAIAAGISTDSNASLDVLLNPTIGSPLLDAIDLPANLTSPPVTLAASGIDPSNGDAAPLVVANSSGNRTGAGPQVIQLSNGLYASDFYENTAGAGYWEKGVNEGIRLVQPELDGLLSNPFAPATSIFDTLGNATSGGACNLSNAGAGGAAVGVSLAAGANGTVWVLSTGQDSSAAPSASSDAPYTTGRQLIELSPSAGSACAGPSGTFTVANGSEAPQPASSPLTIPAGATVNFNASSIDYPTSGGDPASIYAYEWDPTGSGSFTTVSDTPAAPGDFGPLASASYQYTTPGVYSAELTLLGDFGEYDQAGTIVVQASSPPTAAFTAPSSAQTGQTVTFNASASQPASGAQIADYHWSFGDGVSDDTQSASDTHAYAAPGTYTVTLTVRDNDEQQSAPVSQQITVTAPSSPNTTTPTTTTTTTSVDRSATDVSPAAVQKGDDVVVTLSCPATKVSCGGTAEVKTASAVATGVAKAGKKAKKSVLVLGQKTFSLNGGQRETLTIALSAKGLALLKTSKRLKVDVVVSAHDSYGDPSTRTLTLTLTTSSKKK